MIDTRSEAVDLTSFNQLIHEFIGGAVRRHKFTLHELEFLLDLQACNVRKSAQPDMLRRYLKVVQQRAGEGAEVPMRLSVFIETGARKRVSRPGQNLGEIGACEPGLSSK
ncbi:MAG: hypothetical protein ACRD4O_13380 [Bryobacteraceae bacterium]